MSQQDSPAFVEQAVELLVQHFGIDRVQAALTTVTNGTAGKPHSRARPHSRKGDGPPRPSVARALERLREQDKEKHALLSVFYEHLKSRTVLPESEDFRHYAQLIGLKDIPGKSRRDMLSGLMLFLLAQPTDRLRLDIEATKSVSEYQRRQGFSVLTDKLVADKK